MASDVMIEASSLTKRYGSLRALDKVSFEVHRGEVVGFLGPNGAGKSTTMRILTCFISASAGTARVHGYDVFDEPLDVRRKLGYLPQRAPLYGEMNVWEYLSFVADMRGLDQSVFRKRMKGIVEVCGLAQVLGKDIGTLSHGYRQRVGLGQALVHDPPILILDEPTSDLDPNEKAEVIRYIKEIGKERTILLSTHNLSEVEAACARAIIVSKGRVVADGPLDEIRAKSGKVRYVVTVHEKKVFEGGEGYRSGSRKPPSAQEVQEALSRLPGVTSVTELPTDDNAHSFQLLGALGGDIRPELFQLIVQKGWLLLELRRDSQSLEDVFKSLTRGDERKDRGRKLITDDEDDDEASAADDDEDDEDDDDGAADDDDSAGDKSAKDGSDEEGAEDEAPAKKKG
ncbi:ATP-binding cassette domain-containing protein [Sorangium sp. So ce1024]|uniref:ATP-binding cassette domain-containing protein n=1 Tax=Sorangium sp. So ce1024 TaxID=3133327 RepID=UPI003F0765FD